MIQRAFCSWSGGKDSCLALNRAVKNGYEITHLLTMFDESGERSRSHSVSREMMRAQADALDRHAEQAAADHDRRQGHR